MSFLGLSQIELLAFFSRFLEFANGSTTCRKKIPPIRSKDATYKLCRLVSVSQNLAYYVTTRIY